MREITEQRTITETVGYEAIDGRRFKTKEECEKYEQSAEHVINSDMKAIMVGEKFPESDIWSEYGYGCEEFYMGVIDIRNADCLEIANKYFDYNGSKKLIQPELIGNKVLVNLGYTYDKNVEPNARSMDKLVHDFIKNLEHYFGEEYTLSEIVKSKAAYMLKNAIQYYDDEAYDVSDLINKVREIYEMIK